MEKEIKEIKHRSASSVENEKPTELDAFISAIKSGYLKQNFITSNFHKSMPIEIGDYIRLALVDADQQRKKEHQLLGSEVNNEENPPKNKNLLDDQRLTSFEEIYGAKQSIELEDIFNRDVNKKGGAQLNRLIILGRAGIGKSTLCRYIAYSWAKSENSLWKDKYKLLISIPLRQLIDLPDEKAKLINIIWDLCIPTDELGEKVYSLEETKKLFYQIEKTDILYLLDGYDEVADKVEETGRETAQSKLLKFLLAKDNVIITSRPYRIGDYVNSEVTKHRISRKLEIIGFLDENIDQYISAFFSEHDNKEHHISTLKEFLNRNANIRGIAHIPINLSLLCLGWLNELGELYANQQGEITVTRLYQGLLVDLCSRYLKKQNISESFIGRVEILKSNHCQSIITFLSELAFLQMNKESLYIPYQSIEDLARKYGLRQKDLDSRLDFGLIQSYKQKHDKSYYFIHLTFQEFLAGYYIAEQLRAFNGQTQEVRRELESYIQKYKYSSQHEIMWWFVAGLLKEDSQTLERFFTLLESAPNDHGLIYHQMLLLRSMEECQLKVSKERRENFFKRLIELIKVSIDKHYWDLQNIIISYLSLSQNVFQQEELRDFFIPLLSQEDWKKRYVLGFFLIKSSLPLCILAHFAKWLQNENWRYPAVQILSFQNSLPLPILQLLIKLLQDKEIYEKQVYVITEIRRTLGSQSSLPPPIIDQLVKLLSVKDNVVRSGAVEALRAQSLLSPETTEKLVNLLQNQNKDVRLSAVMVLGGQSSPSPEILKQFDKLLQDEDGTVRRWTLNSLNHQKSLPPKIIDQIVKLLLDKEHYVRSAAAEALGAQNSLPPLIIDQLAKLLKDDDDHVKSAAAEALGAQNSLPPPIIDQLANLLENDDDDDDVRSAAAKALGAQNSLPPPIIDQLAKLLEDDDVRSAAAEALSAQNSLPPPIIDQLTKLLQNENGHVRSAATKALGAQNSLSPSIINQLTELLKNTNKDVRYAAAKVLRAQSPLRPEIIEKLAKLLQHEDTKYVAEKALSTKNSLSSEILDHLGNLCWRGDIERKGLIADINSNILSISSLIEEIKKQAKKAISINILVLVTLKLLVKN